MMKYYETKNSKKDAKTGFLFNKHIVLHQYEHNAKALIIWSLVVGALMAMVVLLYPTFKDMYPEMIAGLPEAMQDIMNAIGGGFSNITEFYAAEGGQLYVLVVPFMLHYWQFRYLKTKWWTEVLNFCLRSQYHAWKCLEANYLC